MLLLLLLLFLLLLAFVTLVLVIRVAVVGRDSTCLIFFLPHRAICSLDEELQSVRDYLGGDVIIKDYVKSEKGNPDLFILSKELSNQEFYEKILQFIDARGKLFNAGIVFKQVENLKKYEGNTNEWRFFLIDGEPLVMEFNGVQGTVTKMPSLPITLECCEIAKKIDSRFITIDIAEKEDGSWMILEAGDGQVSGMPTETMAIAFYNKLKNDFKFGIE